VHHLQKILCFM